MTDEQMKLSEAEIIKALECCGNMNECKKECPLDDLGGIDKCVHTLILNALALINRQKAELADLNNLLKLSNDIQNEYIEKIDEQKAEIERLKAKCENTQVGYNIARADMEEFKAINESLKADSPFLIANAKSEAIKEFAQRLKKEYADFDKLNEIIQIENLFLCIDDLVREMTEQRKEDEGK